MGKNEIKKKQKRTALLESAYHLFTTVGFSNTTIQAISAQAGVAKGTFYLYFDNKEHLRDELIVIHSSQVLEDALEAMRASVSASKDRIGVSDRIICVMDYILDLLSRDRALLTFVAKDLSLGLLLNAGTYRDDNDDVLDFRSFVKDTFAQDGIELRDPLLLFYTLIELVSSTCYSIILSDDPVPLETYLPYLHRTIKLLVDDAVIRDVE